MGLRIQNNVEAFNTHRQLTTTSTQAAKSAIEMATVMRMIRSGQGTAPSKETAGKNGATRRFARKHTI